MFFSSHAKLLITGEYLVMLGAKALALPLKFRQSLAFENVEGENIVHWHSMENGTIWFEAKYSLTDFEIISASDNAIALNLCKILIAAREINPLFLKKRNPIKVKTDMDFSRHWGLGTSSTLISNIAYWANIDPFQLHWKVSEGSGYDIACARETEPIIYSVENQIPVVEKANFNPAFINNIYFVYLGNKQNSSISIQQIDRNPGKYKMEIDSISFITKAFINVQSINGAIELIAEHEEIIGSILKQTPVKKSLFGDFKGAIKSLGAWGGDFIMVISSEPSSYINSYFEERKREIIFPLKKIAY